MTFSLLLPLVDAIPPCFSPSGRSSHSRRLDSNELVNRQWLSHCYSEPPKTDILQPKDEGDFRELRPQLKAECICILLTLLAIFAASYSSRSWLISPDLIQRTEAWRHSTPERVVAGSRASSSCFRGTQRQFLETICSEDDLRSRIFGTFVVKFLACLPLLGFSNIWKMV